ncbi:MAG: hypothetical protein PWR04_827, partial [Anaerophaga sp.]|nr:hypothetical protein [Anaerophaga sp.]
MKLLKDCLFFFLIAFIPAIGNARNPEEPGHEIEVTLNGFRDTTLILGHYFNQRMYVDDTTRIDSNGKAVFAGQKPLPGGIYVVYLPNQRYFDLLIDEDQHFEVKVDTADMVSSMQVTGSEQTAEFNKYQRFIIERQNKAKALQQKLQDTDPDSDDGEKIKEQLENLNQEVKNKWKELTEENPGT